MKKVILFPLILILAVYFTIAFVVPQFQKLQALRAEIKQKDATFAALKQDFDAVSESVALIEAREQENAFIDRIVPENDSEQDVINALSRIAEKNNAQLSTVGFFGERETRRNQLAKKEISKVIAGEFVTVGTYEQLFGFVQDVLRMDRLYSFEGLTIEVLDAEDLAGEAVTDQLQLSARLSYYHIPVNAPKVVVPAELKNFNYDAITSIRERVRAVPAISGESQNRPNPFAL